MVKFIIAHRTKNTRETITRSRSALCVSEKTVALYHVQLVSLLLSCCRFFLCQLINNTCFFLLFFLHGTIAFLFSFYLWYIERRARRGSRSDQLRQHCFFLYVCGAVRPTIHSGISIWCVFQKHLLYNAFILYICLGKNKRRGWAGARVWIFMGGATRRY